MAHHSASATYPQLLSRSFEDVSTSSSFKEGEAPILTRMSRKVKSSMNNVRKAGLEHSEQPNSTNAVFYGGNGDPRMKQFRKPAYSREGSGMSETSTSRDSSFETLPWVMDSHSGHSNRQELPRLPEYQNPDETWQTLPPSQPPAEATSSCQCMSGLRRLLPVWMQSEAPKPLVEGPVVPRFQPGMARTQSNTSRSTGRSGSSATISQVSSRGQLSLSTLTARHGGQPRQRMQKMLSQGSSSVTRAAAAQLRKLKPARLPVPSLREK